MTENGGRRRGFLTNEQGDLVRALFWGWVKSERDAGRKPTKRAFGKLIGITGEAVSTWAGGEERWVPGSHKRNPGWETADEVGKIFGKPSNWWRGASDEPIPAELDSVRILRVARDLSVSDDVVLILQGDGASGARMKNLSENKRKAVLGAVHLLGYPLEQVLEVAEQIPDRDDEDPSEIYAKIERRLRGKPPRSGSYPSVVPEDQPRRGRAE